MSSTNPPFLSGQNINLTYTASNRGQPEEDSRNLVFDADVLRYVADVIDALTSADSALEDSAQGLYITGDIAIESANGFRIGWVRVLDGMWYFHPDVRDL